MSGTGLKRPEAQTLLGSFLFSGWDEHEKRVTSLSGGERRRLALAIVVASGANFLVLDEPTNHLDLESREALEIALDAFPGTILLVSHDRAVLDAVASRLLAVEDRHIVSYPGGWADYVRAQESEPAAPVVARPAPKPKVERPKRPAKPRPTALQLVEAEVARAEARVAELEVKLAADWADMALLSAHREAREDLEALLKRWESLFEATSGRDLGLPRPLPASHRARVASRRAKPGPAETGAIAERFEGGSVGHRGDVRPDPVAVRRSAAPGRCRASGRASYPRAR